MPEPLRVLSLYEGFFAGGARILHTDVVAGLHAAGQRHSVLSLAADAMRESTRQPISADARYRRLVDAGVAVHALARTAGGAPTAPEEFTPGEIETAAALLADADVVLSLKEQPLGLLLAVRDAGLLPDVPVLACLHRSDPTHSGPALGWLAEAAHTGVLSGTLSCAHSTSEAYARAGVTPAERYVIPNGIDTERFRPATDAEEAATRAALEIPTEAPVIVFAARFDAMKDPGLFLRSAALLQRRRPDAHVVLCGAGMTADNPMLRALADDAEVRWDERIHALGIRDDMPALYGAADIVALTSAFGEASPLCLREGAACGATPVTTAVGDAARDVAGIGVVTPRDARAIAGAWERVLRDRPARRAAALAARAGLDRARMIAEYQDVIEDFAGAGLVAA